MIFTHQNQFLRSGGVQYTTGRFLTFGNATASQKWNHLLPCFRYKITALVSMRRTFFGDDQPYQNRNP
jgi:hypothetical protein